MIKRSSQELNQLIEDINVNYPIKLKHIEDVINKIHNEYPFIEKNIIIIIVKYFFESLREVLILGHTIKINNYLTNMKLNIYNKFIKKSYYLAIKTKLKTAKNIRNYGK